MEEKRVFEPAKTAEPLEDQQHRFRDVAIEAGISSVAGLAANDYRLGWEGSLASLI
jgi:hypothetical protein